VTPRDRITEILYQREPGGVWTFAALLLAPIGWLYGVIMRLRAWGYRRGWFGAARVDCPVISVGNLTAGGVGKTPLTIYLAQALQQRGRRPVVISRGYRGRLEGQAAVVSDGRDIRLTAADAGDEPVLIARRLPGVPVIVGARRPAAAKLAREQFDAGVIICDDAFSHLALRRDCDIVLVHGRDGFGNGRVLPAGPLREPAEAIRRAGLVALNVTAGEDPRTEEEVRRAGYCGAIFRLRAGPLVWRHHADGSPVDPSAAPDRRVLAFTATARPGDVFESFARSGWDVVARQAFPDHYAYTPDDLARLAQLAAAQAICYLATTEKDAVKFTFSLPRNPPLLVAALTPEGVGAPLEQLVDRVEDFCWPDRPCFSTATER
jgi:tetraacyldisaccharide 4'-kinase